LSAYRHFMPSKPIELPPEVAKAFVKDMRAFFKASGTGVRADAIAAQQAWLLNQHLRPRMKKLTLTDVKTMFLELKDHT